MNLNRNKSKCRITDYSEDIVKDDRKCKNCLSRQDILRITRKTIQDVIQDLPEGPQGPKGDPGDTELELHIEDLNVWETVVTLINDTRPNWTIVLNYEGNSGGDGNYVNAPYPGQEWTWDGIKWELTEDSRSPSILEINNFSATSTSIQNVDDLTININPTTIQIIGGNSVVIQGTINIDMNIPGFPSDIEEEWEGSLQINSFGGTPYNPEYPIGIIINGSFTNPAPYLINLEWQIFGIIYDNNNFYQHYSSINGNIGIDLVIGLSFNDFTIDNTIGPPSLANSKEIKSSQSKKNKPSRSQAWTSRSS